MPLDNNSEQKAGGGAHWGGGVRAGENGRPLVRHGPRSWYDKMAPQYAAPAPDPY
jgi:hypothetical protein